MSTGSPVAAGRVVLDTNVISELMREVPHERVVAWVGELSPAAVCTTSITLAEVRLGIARLPRGRRRALLTTAADDVFGAFPERILPFDAVAAGRYADVVARRERAGASISGFDAQIAAICGANHAALATRNTRHFEGLGLTLIDPWK